MKKTLLEIVQSILSDMDSEHVNSLSDSVEAMQIASVVEDTFFNMVVARKIPEHRQLIKITALADSDRPTHFQYDTTVASVSRTTRRLDVLKYNTSTTGGVSYKEVRFIEPLDFLMRNSYDASNTLIVDDKIAGTKLAISNDRMPSYYTSFDDNFIVMDAYNATVESTLQESKTQAYGVVYPGFTIADSFVPDLDDTMFPYLLAEAKSSCFSLFKGGPDPKVEQAAKRLKSYVQNDLYRTSKPNARNGYGRR